MRSEERTGARRGDEGLLGGASRVVSRGVPERDHPGEGHRATGAGAVGSHQGIVAGGGMGERSQQGGLAEADLARVRVEVQRRGGRDAGGPLTQGDPVQVLLENRGLVEVGVEAPRPQHLAELAGEGARRAPQQAGELHRDRGSPRDGVPGAQVVTDRAREAANVHPPVRVEAVIFDRQERLRDLGVQLGERNPAAAAALEGASGPQHLSVAVLEGNAGDGAGIAQGGGKRGGDPRRDGGGDD